MYSYGSFEDTERVILIGFVYKTEGELIRKIKKAEHDGWHYDGVYCPLKQCDILPSYVDIRNVDLLNVTANLNNKTNCRKGENDGRRKKV